jgi:hypothetical protein
VSYLHSGVNDTAVSCVAESDFLIKKCVELFAKIFESCLMKNLRRNRFFRAFFYSPGPFRSLLVGPSHNDKMRENSTVYPLGLKVQCHEILDPRFFSSIDYP